MEGLGAHMGLISLKLRIVYGRPQPAAHGPLRPEDTPPSPRQPGPARGAGDTRGNSTETTRPPAVSVKPWGSPGDRGAVTGGGSWGMR